MLKIKHWSTWRAEKKKKTKQMLNIIYIFVKINICPSLISIKNQFNSKNANEEESFKRQKNKNDAHLFIFLNLWKIFVMKYGIKVGERVSESESEWTKVPVEWFSCIRPPQNMHERTDTYRNNGFYMRKMNFFTHHLKFNHRFIGNQYFGLRKETRLSKAAILFNLIRARIWFEFC